MFNKVKKALYYLILMSTLFSMYLTAEATSIVLPVPLRVDVVNDAGKSFRQYPINSTSNHKRVYIQANNKQQYNIRVRNMSGQRVGVVVTVDGRNILTGKKSWLRSTEKMYLLEPYQTSIYKGWRTGQNRINRFFFTESGNSYAGAWGDKSAMGVIAVAAFYEKQRVYRAPRAKYKQAMPAGTAPAPMRKSMRSAGKAAPRSDAGTGFGRSERSDSTIVKFTPQQNAFSKYFYKYEWRSKLCKRGIIVCNRAPKPIPHNHFWKDNNQGYAPPPPRR